MTGLPDGTRLVVTGNATAEEAAAVLVAIDHAVARQDAARRKPRRPGWQEAARREAVGSALFRSAAELRRP
jgi:hypothetical protein